MSRTEVFAPWTDFQHEFVICESTDGTMLLNGMSGVTQSESWKPLPMKILSEDETAGNAKNSALKRADMPFLSPSFLILRGDAIKAVGQVLEPFGELLPLSMASERIAVFNVLNVVDALDLERSTVVRFPTSGRVRKIDAPYFKEGLPAGPAVFKVPEFLRGPLYLTGDIVEEIRSTGLASGTIFVNLAKEGNRIGWPP